MNTPEKCPKCNAPVQPCLNAVVIQFQCGSMVDAGDGTWHDETTQCIVSQRDQLATKLTALESAYAECSEKMKRFRSRWLAAHQELRRTEDMIERAEERARELESQLAHLTESIARANDTIRQLREAGCDLHSELGTARHRLRLLGYVRDLPGEQAMKRWCHLTK